MTNLVEILEQNPFFEPLTDNQRAALVAQASLRQFKEGVHLLHENKPATEFYLLVAGDVALTTQFPRRGVVTLQTFHAGAVLGWSWLFPPYEWHFDARTNTPVTAVVFDGAAVRASCEADHEFGYQLMRLFANMMLQRLQATRLQLLDVYGATG
ncbi:MAG: Crp/Fnr family transcriptional regulator [Anaerolineales bacterium]|nr:Crp/Fnr family transcriptional regulator [Anaerolineales bacterium]